MKLLITTDFSANSKAALRFAQTLAKQSKNVELVCYHSIHFLKPFMWSDTFYETYQEEETERFMQTLKKFVYSVIGEKNDSFADIQFVIDRSISIEKDIIRYAEKNKIDFICIATQGAGLLRKVMGTHTSYIVNNSEVPVLVIPSHYKAKPIKKATYLSDFENLKTETLLLDKFKDTLSMQIEVLHYASILNEPKKLKKNISYLKDELQWKVNVQKENLEQPLLENIQGYIKKSKPQLLIMFTKRKKGFFESLFVPSKSAELTYSTKVPVLIFSK